MHYWEPIDDVYGLNITVVNPAVDPTLRLHDARSRRQDPHGLLQPVRDGQPGRLKDRFDVAFGNDPDADRHGIVTPSAGLMNPNHYLAVAIRYLLTHRPDWPAQAAVGKTLVSSSMIDRVVQELGRKLPEVPVGFKWFAPGLFDGSFCFGGEESAGASFLRRDGTVWTTDKDGPIMDLLAAEITARTGKDPGEHYQRADRPSSARRYYTRIDAAGDARSRRQAEKAVARGGEATTLAGEPITAKLTRPRATTPPIGGLKVVAANGWFAARPSGTENIYKIYAESFKDQAHLDAIVDQARQESLRGRSRGDREDWPQRTQRATEREREKIGKLLISSLWPSVASPFLLPNRGHEGLEIRRVRRASCIRVLEYHAASSWAG